MHDTAQDEEPSGWQSANVASPTLLKFWHPKAAAAKGAERMIGFVVVVWRSQPANNQQ